MDIKKEIIEKRSNLMIVFQTHTLELMSLWSIILIFIFGGLSVLLALISSFVSNEVSDRVQKESSEKIADAKVVAAKAEEGAAIANMKIEKQKEENALLQLRAAELEKETAVARLEQEKLKATVAWRELTEEQITALTKSLRGHSGGMQIHYVANDPEVLMYATQFAEAAKKSGWRVGVGSVLLSSSPATGIYIENEQQPETSILCSAFQNAGIGFVSGKPAISGGFITMNPAEAYQGAVLFIGNKPRR